MNNFTTSFDMNERSERASERNEEKIETTHICVGTRDAKIQLENGIFRLKRRKMEI